MLKLTQPISNHITGWAMIRLLIFFYYWQYTQPLQHFTSHLVSVTRWRWLKSGVTVANHNKQLCIILARTGRSNWILPRKLKYFVWCFIDSFIILQWHLFKNFRYIIQFDHLWLCTETHLERASHVTLRQGLSRRQLKVSFSRIEWQIDFGDVGSIEGWKERKEMNGEH